MSIGKRLAFLRGALTQADFAAKFGVSKSTYARYEREEFYPDFRLIEALCHTLGVRPAWLVRGEEPVYEEEGRKGEGGAPPRRDGAFGEEQYVFVPCLEGRVTAGPDGGILCEEPDDFYPFKRWWVEKLVGQGRDHAAALVLVRVQGDSMMPTINPGELILVDSWEAERLEVRSGRIYLVRMPDGYLAVKRLMLNIRKEWARLVCLSDNPSYKPFEFDLDPEYGITWHVLGRVRWVGREVD